MKKIFLLLTFISFLYSNVVFAEASKSEWDFSLGQFLTWSLGGNNGTTLIVSTNISPEVRVFFPTETNMSIYSGARYRKFTTYPVHPK